MSISFGLAMNIESLFVIKYPIRYFCLCLVNKTDKSVRSETFIMDHKMKPLTKIKNPKELGQCLLKDRKNLKLTQKEISEFADVGRKFIIEVEKGKTTAQLGKIFELLNSLGLELHLIKRGDGGFWKF